MTRTGILAGLLVTALAVACNPETNRERTGANTPGTTTTSPGTTTTAPSTTTTTTAAASFDQQFIDHVVPHYQYGVDLAQVGKNNATHDELKTWSENAVNTYKAEADRFTDWRKQWFGSGDTPNYDNMPALTGVAPYDFRGVWTTASVGTDHTTTGAPATGMGATGTATGTDRVTTDRTGTPVNRPGVNDKPGPDIIGTKSMPTNVENTPKGQLQALKDVPKENFDKVYLDTMIAYEQHGISALRVAQARGSHPELKEQANMLLDQTQRDLAQLQDWRNAWYGGGTQTAPAGTR